MSIIPRRSFLASIPAAFAGLLGLGKAKGAEPAIKAIGAVAEPLKPAATAGSGAVVSQIRSMFVNRSPLLARSQWIPVERADFHMYDHRHWREGDPPKLVDSTGRLTTVGLVTVQYCQDFQYPVPVEAGRFGLEFNKKMQLQCLVDDMEAAMYYGEPAGPSGPGDFASFRTGGLRSILKTNNIEFGVNRFDGSRMDDADAFVHLKYLCQVGGGNPDLVMVSTDMLGRLGSVSKLERVDAGQTPLGVSVKVFRSSLFDHGDYHPRPSIVECPLLRSGTAIVLTSSEVYVRNKEDPHWSDKIMDNGCYEGWKATMAIEVVNEQHHCWAESRRAS